MALFDKPDFSIVDKKIPVSEARIIANIMLEAMLETIEHFKNEKKEADKIENSTRKK